MKVTSVDKQLNPASLGNASIVETLADPVGELPLHLINGVVGHGPVENVAGDDPVHSAQVPHNWGRVDRVVKEGVVEELVREQGEQGLRTEIRPLVGFDELDGERLGGERLLDELVVLKEPAGKGQSHVFRNQKGHRHSRLVYESVQGLNVVHVEVGDEYVDHLESRHLLFREKTIHPGKQTRTTHVHDVERVCCGIYPVVGCFVC